MARDGYHDIKVYLRERFLYINCSERCYIHSTNYDIFAPINHGLKVIDNATMQTSNETFTGSYVTLEVANTDTQFTTYQLNFLILAAEDLSSSLSAEFKNQILDALKTANDYALQALGYLKNMQNEEVEVVGYKGTATVNHNSLDIVTETSSSTSTEVYVKPGKYNVFCDVGNLDYSRFKQGDHITISLTLNGKPDSTNTYGLVATDNNLVAYMQYTDRTIETLKLNSMISYYLGNASITFETTLKKDLGTFAYMVISGNAHSLYLKNLY